jgi:hypothetical protein
MSLDTDSKLSQLTSELEWLKQIDLNSQQKKFIFF